MRIRSAKTWTRMARGTTRSMVCMLAPLMAAGCSRAKPAWSAANTFPPGYSIAVAPILNFSGQFDVDPIQAADLLASELTGFGAVTVLPVNRVVAALAIEGKTQVESPAHALDIANAVGADAIVIAGITEYDAYTPVIGIVIQMYATGHALGSPFDAVGASRSATRTSSGVAAGSDQPTGQVQRVYHAARDDVVRAVRAYAEPRSAGDSPLGWREYLKVQRLYLRFCWHDALDRLMKQHASRRRSRTEWPESSEGRA